MLKRMKERIVASDFKYLQLLEERKIRPNFWCSQEYFERAGFGEVEEDGWIHVVDEESDVILPPMKPNGICLLPFEFWADLIDCSEFRKLHNATFLDYEYIYNPKDFQDMAGKKWQVFRKNCRKYPNRADEPLYYEKFDPEIQDKKLDEFLEIWAEDIKWDEIHDGHIMIDYIQNGYNREVLIDYHGDIHGMNIFDENYMFINFRYCICLDVPFLSEYLRYLFYINRCSQDKLVNDGGVLDNPKLKKFKDKLNPVEVNKIYSWRF